MPGDTFPLARFIRRRYSLVGTSSTGSYCILRTAYEKELRKRQGRATITEHSLSVRPRGRTNKAAWQNQSHKPKKSTQRAHDVYTTSAQRRCNVMTLHRHWGDVVLTSCARWGRATSSLFHNKVITVLDWIHRYKPIIRQRTRQTMKKKTKKKKKKKNEQLHTRTDAFC